MIPSRSSRVVRHPVRRFSKRCFFSLACACAVSLSAEQPGESGALVEELASLRAEIRELESKLENETAERWRLRHGFKYGDEETIPLRRAAREAQRALVDVRTRLLDHIRGHHPEYRRLERAIGHSYTALRGLREQKEVIERERAMAARMAIEGDPPTYDVAALDEELQTVMLLMEGLEAKARQEAAALIQARDEWAARDERGRELLARDHALEQEFIEATRRLNAHIDAQPALAEFESRRTRGVAQLDALKRRVEELERQLSN